MSHLVPVRDGQRMRVVRSDLSLYERARRWLFGARENDYVGVVLRRIDARALELLIGELHRLTAPESEERVAVDRLAAAFGAAASRGWSVCGLGRVDPETGALEWQSDPCGEGRRLKGKR